MKKLMMLSSFLFASIVSFQFANAATTSELAAIEVQQENRQKIETEDLPDAVIEAWNKSDYAKNSVKEVTKITKGSVVTYEIKYTDAAGQDKIALFSADGKEIG
jgi:hypothetical protein